MKSPARMDGLTLRVLARHAQLLRALRDSDVTAVARAASRARLAELQLLPKERAAGHSARTTVGRALREARLRATHARAAVAVAPTAISRGSKQSRRASLATLAATLLIALFWSLVPTEHSTPRDAIENGGALVGDVLARVQSSENSRGRTSVLFAASVASPPSAAPSPSASTGPTPAAGHAGQVASGASAAGRGGLGTGTGTETGLGSGSGTLPPVPTPRGTAASGDTRIRGRVIDATSRRGVPGVCLVPGSLDCDAAKPHSDADGYWVIDVTNGTYWDIRFQVDGYRISRIRVYAGGRDTNVGNIPIAPALLITP